MQLVQGNNTSETTFEEVISQSPYTLLYFYPKNDTPGCTLEAKDFSDLSEDFASKDIQIVWVSKDSSESHCDFISKYALSPKYISDPDMSLHKQFSTRGEKNNYGKIVMWVIRSTFLLDSSGEIIKERRSIKATGHAERVRKWISEDRNSKK